MLCIHIRYVKFQDKEEKYHENGNNKKMGINAYEYLPYFFFSPSEAADFLNVHSEYKERKIRVVPVQEIHMVEDKQTFYEELQQMRNRVLTGNC